jgi:hypothetical protein
MLRKRWADRADLNRCSLRSRRKLLKKQGFAPKLLVTDNQRSYAAAFRSSPHRLRLRRPAGCKSSRVHHPFGATGRGCPAGYAPSRGAAACATRAELVAQSG